MSEEKWTPAWRGWSNEQAERFAYLAGANINDVNRDLIEHGLEPITKAQQDAIRRNLEGWKAEKEMHANLQRSGAEAIPASDQYFPRAKDRMRRGENIFNVGAQAVLDLFGLLPRAAGQTVYNYANPFMDEEPKQLRMDNPRGVFADPATAGSTMLVGAPGMAAKGLGLMNLSTKVPGAVASKLPAAIPQGARSAIGYGAGAAATGAETYAWERALNGDYLDPEEAEGMGKFAAGAALGVPVLGKSLKIVAKTGTRGKYHFKPNEIDYGNLDNRTIEGRPIGEYQTALLENGSLGNKLGIVHSLSWEGKWGQRLGNLYKANDEKLAQNLKTSDKFKQHYQRLTGDADLPTPREGETLEMAVARRLNEVDAWVQKRLKVAEQYEADGNALAAAKVREEVRPVQAMLDDTFNIAFDEGVGILSADGIRDLVKAKLSKASSKAGSKTSRTKTDKAAQAADNVIYGIEYTMAGRDWNGVHESGRFFPISEYRGLLSSMTEEEIGKVSQKVNPSLYGHKTLGGKALRGNKNYIDRELAKGAIPENAEVVVNEAGEIIRPGSSPMDNLANQTAFRENLERAAKSKAAAIANNQNFARSSLFDVFVKAPLKVSKAYDMALQGAYNLGDLLIPKNAQELAARKMLSLPEVKGGRFGTAAVGFSDWANRVKTRYEDGETPTDVAISKIDAFVDQFNRNNGASK